MAKLGQHPWSREFIWRPDPVTLSKFRELEKMAEGLQQDDEAAIQLQDEMRTLPGFPVDAQLWDVVTILPERVSYSFSSPTKRH